MSTQAITKWVLDPTHSEIGFKAKHLMITTVTGHFNKFEAAFETQGEDISTAKIHFNADVASVDTNNEQRDGHVRSAEFFDSEKFPKLIFDGGTLESKGGSDYLLHGNLTIKGVTKPVTLNVEFGGFGKDPWGNSKAGFSLSGKINRNDFGLSWNVPLEQGGLLVSEEVKIFGEVQFAKQA